MKLEEQLEASLKDIRNLERALDFHAIVAATDPRGKIVRVNDKFCEISKYSREELVGRDHRIINSRHHSKEFFRDLWSTIQRGEVWQGEICNRAKDGSLYWVATTIVPFLDSAGKPEEYVAIRADITERKRAEQELRDLNAELERKVEERTVEAEQRSAELRSLFESLPGLYLVLTRDFRIVGASDAYLRTTMTTREGITGKGIFEVFPDNPEDPISSGVSNLRTSLEFVRQHGRDHTMAIQRYDIRTPEGVFEERYWSPINSPLLGKDGQVQYIIHRVEDVTEFVKGQAGEVSPGWKERMEAEVYASSQRVQQINRQLEAANKELESFSYSVSHDLRSPLRAVDGFSLALLEDYGGSLPEEGRHYVEMIRAGAQKMGRLIDDLLVFSRLSRAPMKRQEVDMAKLVREVLEETQPDNPAVEVTVEKLPPTQGDPALLKQVWMNLVSNAFKYSRKRERPVVQIGCEGAAYFVKDNGAGFDMRYAGKLFGVFQRLHRAEEYEGTGVGLANVQRIISRHGGRVWAEAQADRGANFHFTLGEDNP